MKSRHDELTLMAGYFKYKVKDYLERNGLPIEGTLFLIDELIESIDAVCPLALKINEQAENFNESKS